MIWSTPTSSEVTVKTKHFTGEELIVEVETLSSLAECPLAPIEVHVKVQAMAFPSSVPGDDYTAPAPLFSIFPIRSGAHGTLHSLRIKPENYPNDSKVTITLQLPITSSDHFASFKNADGTADV